MRINSLPSLDDYWRRDPLLHYAPVTDRITLDRFRELSRYLYFADNSTLLPQGTPEHDRLGKVRPVVNFLSRKFSEIYHPHKEVSVDDTMIKFQGQSSLKPLKPVKRGIKVWVFGDGHNGYFSRFEVYSGKEGSVEMGLGTCVVKMLTSGLAGHIVFFDNFTSCTCP